MASGKSKGRAKSGSVFASHRVTSLWNLNFTEEFIFEPRLDPGVSPATIAQLNAADTQLIYVFWPGGTNAAMWCLGFDGGFRRL